jgi:hypothetical protein
VRQDAPPAITVREHDIQKLIVDAVRLCGLEVYETTAYRQKGSSGVDKGIPDLLVCVPGLPVYIGIEVKRPGQPGTPVKYSSPEQREAHQKGHFLIVTTLAAALTQIAWVLRKIAEPEPFWAQQVQRLAKRLETFRDSADPIREVRKVQ